MRRSAGSPTPVDAFRHLELALRGFQALGDKDAMATVLDGLAAIAAQQGDSAAAAALIGRADALLERAGVPRVGYELARRERLEEVARAELADAGFETRLGGGAALSEEGALALAARCLD